MSYAVIIINMHLLPIAMVTMLECAKYEPYFLLQLVAMGYSFRRSSARAVRNGQVSGWVASQGP
jgi:hypothetical protein